MSSSPYNSINSLQEYCQKENIPFPIYQDEEVLDVSGSRTFWKSSIQLDKYKETSGIWMKKRDARRDAASKILKFLSSAKNNEELHVPIPLNSNDDVKQKKKISSTKLLLSLLNDEFNIPLKDPTKKNEEEEEEESHTPIPLNSNDDEQQQKKISSSNSLNKSTILPDETSEYFTYTPAKNPRPCADCMITCPHCKNITFLQIIRFEKKE